MTFDAIRCVDFLETLGLHRVALFVFEFNERAIRAYRRCGFVIEGRSRESMPFLDEIATASMEVQEKHRFDEQSLGSEIMNGHKVFLAEC